MKKELVIQFKIIQYEDIKKQEDALELIVYSVSVPENECVITQEQLVQSGVKKKIQPVIENEHIPDMMGKKYTCKITEKQLKELLDF